MHVGEIEGSRGFKSPPLHQPVRSLRSSPETRRTNLFNDEPFPEFSRAYEEARQQVFAEALTDLRSATQDAVQALRTAVKEESGALRIKAPTAVVRLSIQSAETLEIEARLQLA
jgi:hypothetical protein